ncbi:hypothetical protein LTR33_000071 [Friedmanniomyces endolithicus]|nr:hypothetical protein LTR33_000071 [Friedmanniomyces endolithicus]
MAPTIPPRIERKGRCTKIAKMVHESPLIDLCEPSEDEDAVVIDLAGEDDNDEVLPDAGMISRGQAANIGLTIVSPPPSGYTFVNSAVTSTGTLISCESGQQDVELTDGDFLRVQRIILGRNGQVSLRGNLFRRARSMDRMLLKAQNEICAILIDVHPGTADPALEDHLVDVPLQYVCVRRTIIMTTIPFAGYYTHSERRWCDHSFRDHSMPNDEALELGVLCCRWKRVQYKGVAGKKGYCGAVLKLRQQETDPSKGIADAALVFWWRTLEATGNGPCTLPSGISVDLTSDTDEETGTTRLDRSPNRYPESRTREQPVLEDELTVLKNALGNKNVRQRKRSRAEVSGETEILPSLTPRKVRTSLKGNFMASSMAVKFEALLAEPRTHFDFLAGGGGATTGAEEAGSIITFLLDKSLDACNSLRRAFSRAQILHKILGDFLSNDRSYEVATAHISYPCKTYSPAHTAEVGTCKYDYENEDTACSVNEIVRKTRPKIVTFEQTDGMVRYKKNKHVWRRLLRDITLAEYSGRWRVMDATEHGNPSKQPGHPLPKFPPPRPGPKNTIRKTLAKVGPDRDIEEHMLRHTVEDESSYDDDITLPYTIVCKSGKGDVHPSGKRSFNMQELAMLAGFPRRRRFAPACMTALREIIGNAVPVGLAKDLYKMVHKGLDNGEAEMGQWLVEVGALTNEDVKRVMRKKEPETIDSSMEAEPRWKKKLRATQTTRFDDEDVIMIDDEDVIMIDD